MGLRDLFKRPGAWGGSGPKMKQLELQSNVRECCEKKLSLSLSIDEHIIEPMSMFIEVGPNYEWVIIDNLVPDVGNTYVKKAKDIKATYNLNKVTYNFSCDFLSFIKEDGRDAIKISFPKEIKTDHARKFFRVQPSITRPIKVLIKLGDSEVDRKMRDISEGGFSFIFSESDNFAKYIKKGRHIDLIQFSLPGYGSIKAKGLVRGLFKAKKTFICGLEFFELSDSDMDKIYRYVVERQRQELKMVQD